VLFQLASGFEREDQRRSLSDVGLEWLKPDYPVTYMGASHLDKAPQNQVYEVVSPILSKKQDRALI